MKGRMVVVAILVAALVARLGFALMYESPPPRGDSADFIAHAAALADHGRYPESRTGGPSAFRPPAYPFALAAVYEIAGRDDAPRVFGALLGTLAVALLGLGTRRLFGDRTALIAMALAAAFPPLVMISVAQLSEALFIVFVLGSLACVLRARDGVRWAVAAGALVGAAALARTNGLVLLLPLLIAAGARRERIALVAAALVVIAPWTIRNSTALDRFVLTSTQTGFAFAGAYNDEARTDSHHTAAWRIPLEERYLELIRRGRNEAELERAYGREALDYATEHPTYPLVVLYWATARMLNVADADREQASAREAGVRATYVDLNRYAFWALGLLAVAGSFSAAARAAPRWLWLFPVLLWLSTATVIGFTRYRTPIDPFLIMLAAMAVAGWGAGRAPARR